jgi:hypothetical protein
MLSSDPEIPASRSGKLQIGYGLGPLILYPGKPVQPPYNLAFPVAIHTNTHVRIVQRSIELNSPSQILIPASPLPKRSPPSFPSGHVHTPETPSHTHIEMVPGLRTQASAIFTISFLKTPLSFDQDAIQESIEHRLRFTALCFHHLRFIYSGLIKVSCWILWIRGDEGPKE